MSGVPTAKRHGAVDIDVERRAGLAAEIEPEAGGDAAPWFLPSGALIVRMRLGRLQRLDQADRAEGRAVGRLRALLGGVLEPQLERVHADLLASSSITLSTAKADIGAPGAR